MIKAIHNNVVLQKKVKQGQKGIYMQVWEMIVLLF